MIVQLDNVWKTFGRFSALQGLSIKVPEGSAFALIGANGAGKTTAIKVLMNIIQPTAGTATVLGIDSRSVSPRELSQIGYVSENQNMPPRMTVMAYLNYLRPFYPGWDRSLETSILSQLRLPQDRKIKDLSHGMRMKMSLACALPFRPKLLVLDEPLSGLDPLVRDEFMDGLLHREGKTTVIISSHELMEIENVTTDVAFLDRGTLSFQESLSALRNRLREVRVTLDTEARIPVHPPREWLEMRADGSVLSFVDTRFSEQDLPARVAAVAGPVRHIEVRPIALRSIFTALARAARDERPPA